MKFEHLRLGKWYTLNGKSVRLMQQRFFLLKDTPDCTVKDRAGINIECNHSQLQEHTE